MLLISKKLFSLIIFHFAKRNLSRFDDCEINWKNFYYKFNPQKDKDKKPNEKRIGNCLRLWNWTKCNCAITLYGYHIFAIIPRCFG